MMCVSLKAADEAEEGHAHALEDEGKLNMA